METNYLPEGSLAPNSEFCQTLLNVHDDLETLSADAELLDLALEIQVSTKTCYAKVEQLLNYISTEIHEKICTTSERLVFRTNDRYTPPHHPNGIETGRPDLVCVLASIAAMLDLDSQKRVPWHVILSTIEEKQASDSDDGPGQCGASLACGNQSRPDLVGMYGLSVSPCSFQLQYSCPAGLVTSEEFDWSKDIISLVLYVYTLYCPRTDKPSRDPYITLAPLLCALASIIAMLDLDSRKRIPWHLVLSAIEEKQASDSRAGAGQCGAYLACGNQSRPDLVGMYGLSVSPCSFQLQYSCPAGLVTSEEFDWSKDIISLVLYVYTLYCPRTDKPSRDPYITLAPTDDIFGPPTWNIDVGNKIYRNCQVTFVGQPWTRMTWVVKSGGDEPKIPIVIKDTYRDAQTGSKDGDMYKILHREGTVPGFAAVEREYEVEYAPGCPITVCINDCTRIKTRLIMQTYGRPLTKCKNIVDFFKGMYDILEAHRFMFSERKLLHRDISHGNIVVDAQDATGIVPFTGEKRPVYINEVLTGEARADPMARLIDMDNCANLDQTNDAAKEEDIDDKPLRDRTGTPRFISRSVSFGNVLNSSEFKSMPELEADIVEKYRLVYHDDSSDMRNFIDENNTTHGGHLSKQLQKAYRGNNLLRSAHFEHQPRHDAESVYWCIVVFVLLAKPLNNDEDNNIEGLDDIWPSIADHEVGTSNDKRSSLIHNAQWETWLHEDLSFIANLMDDLTEQVRPEWGLLAPAPKPLHLHEAMQRLILNNVYAWEIDQINVELDTVTPRQYPIEERKQMAPGRHYPIHGQVFSANVRKRANSTEREEPESKRQHRMDTKALQGSALSARVPNLSLLSNRSVF
ncbi:hypothetical protein PLEOSDRAFT_165632 [Pleurotus ostreatus PC15]|uniref:Fungal-type protein kinase domain-containing protein n=2 Tax=Pleurotus TaxID=5320 RepID=A0A067P0L3_PLEO1|nr:hypothetical protein CCMSSC00406_0009053 [Pleurotus cornucopiae]KDQ29942.1 hypothetical protein PLEOSDRAFT_165632 [Pleurotus ostreatus PC15]